MSTLTNSFLLVCVWAVIILVNCELSNSKHVGIFVFGDSLYDPGNLNNLNISIDEKANYWPYGETFFNFSTGRFCDGLINPDFIAMKVNIPLWKPYLEPGTQNFTHGANFAAGGAGVLPQSNAGATISLMLQMSFFEEVVSQLKKEVGEEEAQNILMKSIYLSSIGGNDYNYYVTNNPNTTLSEGQEFVQLVIGNLTQVIKEIYEMGGRKFAFQNVGPMGCLPFIRVTYGLSDEECLEELMELSRLHNKLLLKAAKELETDLPGFKYSIFDYYSSLYDIIKHPTQYGFQFAATPCCGAGSAHCGIEPYELCSNTSEYVYFDNAHPTQALNMLLSNLMWDGDSTFTTPYNFKQLFELEVNMSNFSSDYHLKSVTKHEEDSINGFTLAEM
ncbi:GDSL lipase-like [Euphorbia lathyris]|uniref:GDSL lipase-like n=1 Tax=Euphorbia lathyris TaxID=212925 RepID=UPI003313B9C9